MVTLTASPNNFYQFNVSSIPISSFSGAYTFTPVRFGPMLTGTQIVTSVPVRDLLGSSETFYLASAPSSTGITGTTNLQILATPTQNQNIVPLFSITGFNFTNTDTSGYYQDGDLNGLIALAIGTQPELYIDNGSGNTFRFVNAGQADVANATGGNAKVANIIGAAGQPTAAVTQALSSQVTLTGSPLNSQATITVNDTPTNLTGFDTVVDLDGRLSFGTNTPTAQVYRLYEAALGRAPDPLGLGTFTYDVTGGIPITAIAQTLIGSPEFQAKYGALNDPGFITLTYQNVLGRTPSQSELNFWLGTINAGATRASIEVGFANSAEFIGDTQAAVTAGLWAPDPNAVTALELYQATLNRLPDKGGLAYWTNELDTGAISVNQMASEFYNSPEFQNAYGGLSTDAFVSQLYQRALGRAADGAGKAFWDGQIDSGTLSRPQVLAGFATSPELAGRLLPDYAAGIKAT